MNADSILDQLQMDLSGAEGSHNEIVSQMETNYSLYAGEQYGSVKKQDTTSANWLASGFKLKDIKRAVEGSIPDLTSPFVETDEIVELQSKGADGAMRSKVMADAINRQFTKSQDKIEFIENIARDIQIDGTSFVKVGWGDNQAIVENIMSNELILDPSARRMKDLRFAIQRRKVMFQSIVDNVGWFGEHSAEELSVLEATTETEYDRSREGSYGRDDSYNFDDRPRQLIEVFEYYGVLDIGNGLEPVLCIWSDNMLLRATPSPYPDSWNGIPFESAVYQRVPHNIYGTGLPEILQDYQSLRDEMMRGIIDNMDRATNGQKFIRKGGMDELSFRKMTAGSPIVWTNKDPREVIMDGGYNEIPQSVFGLMEQLKVEQEELSGISRNAPSSDSRMLNSGTSATAANIVQDNSQKRVMLVARHISEMLSRVFSKFIDINVMLLEDGSYTDNDGSEMSFSGSHLAGEYDIKVTAGTAGMKQQKLQNINVMMQQLIPQAGNIPNSVVLGLIADMANTLDMPVLSREILTTIEQTKEAEMNGPSMEEQMMMEKAQLDLAEQESVIQKNSASAMKDQADSVETMMEADRLSYTPID